MFFFLSKLLPLFVYPLGLSLLLMLASLVLLWKRPRCAAFSVFLAFVVLMAGGNGWVCAGLVRSLESQHIPTEELPTAEAIVVLGGATRSPSPPRPWVEVNEAGDRTLYGAKLYLDGKAEYVVLSGGRISWRGEVGSEAEDMAKIVEAMGVPSEQILLDRTSLNTHQNAVNVKEILEERGIQRVLLVTSALHMPRSLRVFKKQGIDAIPAPTDFLVTDASLAAMSDSWEAIVLNIIPDAHRLALTTRALKEYVGIVVYGLRGWL
ncbi:Putative membrane protein [Geitlerinema sp. FC II]|nr:YdcF family protein [Geitlerinema sp. CS-897]PPT09289.1 Putative membrane protein [Geitlerinema sp. FC II]